MDRNRRSGCVGIRRERYLRAPRAEKRELLDEVVAVPGLHRKAAIRLVHRPPRPPGHRPRSGRPRVYGPAVAAVAQVLSEATGHIGPHRWHPLLPELLDRLTQSGDVVVTPDVDNHLRQVSPATLARLLAPFPHHAPRAGRHHHPVRGLAQARDPRPHLRRVERRLVRTPVRSPFRAEGSLSRGRLGRSLSARPPARHPRSSSPRSTFDDRSDPPPVLRYCRGADRATDRATECEPADRPRARCP